MKVAIDGRRASDCEQPRRNSTRFAALFFLAATIIIAPLSVIDIPLLADYPNHVARMHVIGNLESHNFLRERYVLAFDLLPNIAMDLAVPMLAKLVPLDVAARIFLAFCLLSTISSVAFLHRTLFHQWSSFSLLAALFAYHGSMIAGLANFSLGIGLVPAALAIWIRMENTEAAWRILAGCGMMLLLFFCHLVAAGTFGLLVIGYGIARTLDREDRQARWRMAISELAVIGAVGLPASLLFIRVALGGDDGGIEGDIVYGNLAWKLKALLSPIINYNLALDLGTFAGLGGLALVLGMTGRLRLDKRMAPGLLLLTLAFLLAPKALWTGGVFDQRFAVLLALMLVASSHAQGPYPGLLRATSILLGALFIVRMAILTSTWIDHRADLAEMREAAGLMVEGGRILVVRPDVESAYRLAPNRHRVFHHGVQLQSLPALATLEKSAFFSSIYAIPGQQPFALKPPFDRLGGRGPVDLPTLGSLAGALSPDRGAVSVSPELRDWPSDFDYVLMLYGYGPGLDPRTTGLPLEPMLDGAIIDLFRITKN
jgi:hypothetical protein